MEAYLFSVKICTTKRERIEAALIFKKVTFGKTAALSSLSKRVIKKKENVEKSSNLPKNSF